MKKKKVSYPVFVPFGTRCVVKRRETKTETAGGILLPGEAEKLPEGLVISVGDKCETVKEGDYVLFGNYSGHEVITGGMDCLVVLEEDIVGRVSGVNLEKLMGVNLEKLEGEECQTS